MTSFARWLAKAPSSQLDLLGKDLDALAEILALGLLLQNDRNLQRALGANGPRTAFALTRPSVWIEVGSDAPAEVHRKAPSKPIVDLAGLVRSHQGSARAIQTAAGRPAASEEAWEMIEPLTCLNRLPMRGEIAPIERWRPLIEQAAYKVAARASGVIDEIRPDVRAALSAGDEAARPLARLYWSLVSLVGRTTLFGAGDGAGEWLTKPSRA